MTLGAGWGRPGTLYNAPVVAASSNQRDDEGPAQTLDDDSAPMWALDECARPSAPAESESPRIGGTLDGAYRIRGVLGSGGMGTVYLALDEQLQRDVAVKLIHEERFSDAHVVERFLAEARAMARVQHPNVVTIHAFGSRRGQPYLVMEYVPGTSLAAWRRERGVLAPAEAVAVLEALCRGVQAIHDAGAVHRDLKPGNVLIGPAQRVAVTDFGLARLVAEQATASPATISGTPAYLAPEIARGDVLVPALATRLDVYALGVIAFELLTGQLPFSGPGAIGLLNQHAYEQPPQPSKISPELSPAFDSPLLEALAKTPHDRPPSAEALRRGLLDALKVSAGAPPGPRILLVDDDTNALAAVRELLQLSFPGAEVTAVNNPASALASALSNRPDLVITDLHMPHGGGLALTSALRRDAITKDVPIVVITAYGGGSDWRELRALGADRFLVKPVDIDILASVVRSLMAPRHGP
jgi:serine/threonine protein kinase